jgi:hypothetical protein
VPVADGSATATLPGITTAGAYTVQATFTPAAGANLRASQDSRTLTVVEGPAFVPSTTVITLGSNAVEQGQAVQVTASVAVPGLPASGQVEFRAAFEGEIRTATAPVSGGEATAILPTLGVGTWVVTGTFQPAAGSGAAASTSGVAQVVVSPATAQLTRTEVALSGSRATRGEAVSATATVQSTGATPQGTVTFSVGGLVVEAAVVGGRAVAVLPLVDPGVHQVLATFVPADAQRHRGSTSAPVGLTVQDSTALALSLSAQSAPSDRPVTATATVTGTGGVPSGTVTFTAGGRAATVPTVNGAAVATLLQLAPGDYEVEAEFTPTHAFTRGSSDTRPLRVTTPVEPPVAGPVETALTLGSNAAKAPYGKQVQVSARVPADAEGIVTFSAGGNTLDVTVRNGRAQAKLPVLAVGQHQVVATFLPRDPKSRRPATATTSLNVVKDKARISFGKRWRSATRRLDTVTRVRPANGSLATGKVTVLIQKKVGKKYRRVVKRTSSLDGNGFVTFTKKLPTSARGTYRVRVTYSGSPSLAAGTFTKTFRIG